MKRRLNLLHVLVADDDVYATEMYKVALEGRGHTVIITHDGQECLNSYVNATTNSENAGKSISHSEAFDVVILDYKMPIMDGLEAAKKILSINSEQRIIFASAFVKETLMESVRELNQVVELIQKPFEPDLLVNIVEDHTIFSSINDLNSFAADMVKKGEDMSSGGQIDKLLRLMKKIQKPGTI